MTWPNRSCSLAVRIRPGSLARRSSSMPATLRPLSGTRAINPKSEGRNPNQIRKPSDHWPLTNLKLVHELRLACADFTFPLLPHERALDLIAMLDFDGADIGLFE